MYIISKQPFYGLNKNISGSILRILNLLLPEVPKYYIFFSSIHKSCKITKIETKNIDTYNHNGLECKNLATNTRKYVLFKDYTTFPVDKKCCLVHDLLIK